MTRVKGQEVVAQQRSEEWFSARAGNVTGSRLYDVVNGFRNPTKKQLAEALNIYIEDGIDPEDDEVLSKLLEDYPIEFCERAGVSLNENSSRITYKKKLVSERIAKRSFDDLDNFLTRPMMWGQITEMNAKTIYRTKLPVDVQDANFYKHPDIAMGVSPDGIVTELETGEVGCCEIKCLEPWNHLYEIIMHDNVPDKYIPQVQAEMWLTDLDWCDFIGFDPRLPSDLAFYLRRIKRDNFYIDEVLEPGVRRFLSEVDTMFKQIWAIKKSRSEINYGD